MCRTVRCNVIIRIKARQSCTIHDIQRENTTGAPTFEQQSDKEDGNLSEHITRETQDAGLPKVEGTEDNPPGPRIPDNV